MPENPEAPANGPEVTPPVPAAAPAATPAPAPTDDVPGADALGDPGKRALDAMKQNWHSERDQRKALEQRIADLEAAKSAPDPRADKRIVRAEIKAAAKGLLADPSDALTFLKDQMDSFPVNEDGEVDSAKITAALEELLKNKPHLAAEKRPRFQGSADSGAQGRTSQPDQLTRADLKGKSPEFIAKARSEGRLNDVLGIKN